MPSGNKSSNALKQNCKVCLGTYDLLLPPGMKGLRSQNSLYLSAFTLCNNFEKSCIYSKCYETNINKQKQNIQKLTIYSSYLIKASYKMIASI